MKKLILILLLLIPIVSVAQLPEQWFTENTVYVFNPNAQSPKTIEDNCTATITRYYDNLEIKNCNGEIFEFTIISDIYDYITDSGDQCYRFFVKEPSSGTTWSCLFYTTDFTISIMDDKESLIIMYTNF